MKKCFRLLAVLVMLCATSNETKAQLVINDYAAVQGVLLCSNAWMVDASTGFNIGDTVLIIQMKDADIDSSNTGSFGDILNYNSAGNYEYNVVKYTTPNSIVLLYKVERNYNIIKGKVQLVRVPSYTDYAVTQPHTCAPWNGTKGGVFAIYVKNTLTLNDTVQVTGKGFHGGTNNQTPTVTGPIICGNPNFYMAPNYDSGSMKGEGITQVSLAKSYGRGKLANGGGGGNAHNAGGAGGGNGNMGGNGGSEYYGCNFNPANNTTSGLAGAGLTYSNAANKIFMGGGGGSAQANNLTVSNGGNGGGICIITAGSITGNSKIIMANGADASQCVNNGGFGSCHDGSAGGGAGGVVVLNTTTVTGNLNIEAKGGKGGNEAASSTYGEVGPGGGGSGGVLWVKPATTPSGIVSNLSGGANGIILYNNATWGAQPGGAGQSLQNLVIDFPVDTFDVDKEVTADFDFVRTSCFTFDFTDLSTSVTGTVNAWEWDFSSAPGSVLANPSHTFPDYGQYYVKLFVFDDVACGDTITKLIDIPYIHFANAGADVITCSGQTVSLLASGGQSYSWAPPTGLSDAGIAGPQATVTASQTYVVTVTNDTGCVDKDTVTININPGPGVTITASNNTVSCGEPTVQLFATGALSYRWSPGQYCDDSTSASPKVSPPSTTTFTVTSVDASGCTSIDTITIRLATGDSKIIMPNAFSPNGDGLNDKIKPILFCGYQLELFAIYNRWGQKIFVTTKPDGAWDGFFDGKPADTGTYFYYLKGKNDDGTQADLKGDITLIR